MGSFAEVRSSPVEGISISPYGVNLLVLYPIVMISIAMAFILSSWGHASEGQRRSGMIFLVGLWVSALGGIPYMLEAAGTSPMMAGEIPLAALSVTTSVALAGLIFSIAIFRGQMVMMVPVAETAVSSTKASFDLRLRRVYLVQEEKPELSFEMFVDILKGRCFDCEDDESFPCESLDCRQCLLPCPCRECRKYESRPQGLVITRQFPDQIRSQFFIQTTPIIWLSTVAGKDNLNPGKLSLLTDMLINFMEKSKNGVVLVDGIEYLMTSNEFSRVLRAVDTWTETAMVSEARLIISLDPRAFDPRELALLEKNKEIMHGK